MRLCVLFLACSLSLTHAAETYAQKTKISIDASNQTVETVLNQIKAKTGFDFFFNNKHVDLNRRLFRLIKEMCLKFWRRYLPERMLLILF